MTPLGHIGISLLAAEGFSKIFPSLDKTAILSATTLGGVIPDLDLLYHFHQKQGSIFDKTIGNHRFFRTHTPIFALLISTPIFIINSTFGLFFFTGTIIHFLVDSLFFPEGINFFYPLNRKMVTFFTIKAHNFLAPKPISRVDDWPKNYLTSPLFWIFEVVPTIIAFVLLFK